MRALIGAVIGFIILRLEGWPISLIIQFFNLSLDITFILIYLIIGIIIGFISGTTILGIISSTIIMPSIVVLFSFFTLGGSIFFYIQTIIQTIPLFYLALVGILGGYLSNRYIG